MDPVATLLATQSLSLASQAIYDLVKARLNSGKQTIDQLSEALEDKFPGLKVIGATVVAQTAIDFFAERGDIEIRESDIHAKNSVWMRSAVGTKLTFGDGSSSATDRTRIDAGRGARIEMTGGASIEQDEDGNIKFRV